MFTIGIDLGGTNCRLGAVAGDGKVLYQDTIPVGKDRSPKGIVNFLADRIKKTRNTNHESRITNIGIGAPGVVDFERGVIISSPHYPGWHKFHLRDELAKACDMPVTLDNDANMVALGEGWLGAGRGVQNFIMITLGTGIGGGIIINGGVFHGDFGSAGEIGHHVMQFDGIKCDCGGRGCWETIVSAEGLKVLISGSDDPRKGKFLEQFHGEIDKVSPDKLHRLAGDGDIFANLIWKKFGAYLGAGVASLANVLGINTVIIGGGLTGAWDFFISETKREISKRTCKYTAQKIVIKRAELGELAGVLGAARAVSD